MLPAAVTSAVIFVAMCLAFFVYWLLFSPVGLGRGSESGISIAKQSMDYLGGISQGTEDETLTCESKESCLPVFEIPTPPSAWRLFALSGLLKSTGDPTYKILLEKNFGEIESLANERDGRWTIIPALKAFDATGEAKYLQYAFRAGKAALYRSQHEMRDEQIKSDGTQIAASSSVQFGELAHYLNEPAHVSALSQLGVLPVGDEDGNSIKSELIREAERAEKIAESAASSEGIVFKNSDVKLTSNFCWILWARYSIADAKEDSSQFESLEKDLDNIDFTGRERDDFAFSNLMEVLPCIHLLQDYGERKNTSSHKKEIDWLFESYVMPLWDSPKRVVCSGDGGLIAGVRNRSCEQNIKSAAITAWAAYLFSRAEGRYSLHSK